MSIAAADSNPDPALGPSLVPSPRPCDGTRTGELSKLGRMFSTLEFLAATDPDAFWAVTSQIAESLEEAAALATGRHAAWLADMAGRFTIAAKEGSTDAILMATRDSGRFRFCAREFQAIRAIATTASSLAGDHDLHVQRVWDGIYELVERTAATA